MSAINCEVNFVLTQPSTCVITNFTNQEIFEIIDAKLYIPVLTLSNYDNGKLLQQLKSDFKRTKN